MTSCVIIHWPPNRQQFKCVPNVSNRCPHSHVRRLNAKGWIKSEWKHNVEVKVKCVMWNEWIYGLTTNHNLAPLPKQGWMWTLDAEEMESSSKIDLKDVLWWMSIKDVSRPRVPILYINSLRPFVRLSDATVLRFNSLAESACIFYGRTGPAGELKCIGRFSSPTLLLFLLRRLPSPFAILSIISN